MRSDATSSFIAAAASTIVRPAFFLEATFTNGTVYAWSGVGAINWNGQTWLGVSSFGSISNIEEGSAVEAKGISVSLSGVDPTLLTDVLNDYEVGLPVIVYFGLFDASGTLIPNPITSFAGRMDQSTIAMDGQTATITINCESRLVEMNVAVDRRYTTEDQQLDFPGDRGFDFVNSIQDITIFWGRHPAAQNNFAVQGTG